MLESVKYYDKALMLDPENIFALKNRAKAYADGGMYSKAIPLLLQIVERDENNVDFYVTLGTMFYKQGLFQRSINFCEKAV